MDEFQKVVNDEKISYWKNAYEAARGAEALVFLTEWNEFRNLDLKKLKNTLAKPVILDLRNIYEPERVTDIGFRYMGVGRGITV
jgi:UDPglucose 6-dehydrogenase